MCNSLEPASIQSWMDTNGASFKSTEFVRNEVYCNLPAAAKQSVARRDMMLVQLQHFGDLHLIARNFAMCACILAILTWRPGFSTVQSTCEQEPAASWCDVGKRDDKQCHRICCWEMLLYVLLPTNASRMRNEIDPGNYMRKSNQQPYSQSANSKKSRVDDKVSDSSDWLMLMHYGETGSVARSNKSQTVLFDLCRCRCTSFWNRKILRFQGSQRTSKWELGRTRLEIPVPLRALLFHHPQCLQNIVSMAPRVQNIVWMAPRAKRRSFWATAWSHLPRCSHRLRWAKRTKPQRCGWSHQSNETKCAWACLRWRQWLNVATVGSICFSNWRGISSAMLRAVLSCGPAASLWCHPADNEYELHRAPRSNHSNSMELHVHSFQSHTWKQPLSQTRRDLLWWHPSCKRHASCQAA